MGYAILRTQKLKSPVAVRRSMKHAFREQDTPNADPERLAALDAALQPVNSADLMREIGLHFIERLSPA